MMSNVFLMVAAALVTLSQGAEVKVTTSGRVNFTEATIHIRCKASKLPDPVNELPIILQLLRVSTDNVTTPVAVLRSDGLVLGSGVNGSGSLGGTEGARLEVSLEMPVEEEKQEDEAIFLCRYVYFSMTEFRVASPSSKLQLSLLEPKETAILPTAALDDCDCDLVWTEVKSLRETVLAENAALKKQLKAYDDSCRVSFSANLKDKSRTDFHTGPLIFDTTLSNKGQAYNVTTGSFTAPCSGQYFLQLSLTTQQEFSSGKVDAVLEADDKEVARTSVFTSERRDHYEQASIGVALTLAEGSQIRVRITTTSQGRIFGEGHSVFSGFFISP